MQHYHRTWAEISLDAIAHNVQAARACIPAGVRLMCVIKADGYGHGALALARFLEDKCEYYAVAVLEEALTLRAAGIRKPILLLGYTSPSQYDVVVAAGLSQTIFSAEAAHALSQAACKAGKRVKLHFAVDTGMARIGFPDTPATAAQLAALAKLPGLEAEGIFTHLARADEADKASAQEQFARFAAFCAAAEQAGLHVPVRHICNSAGIMELASIAAHDAYDMVRLGISLYGLYPSEEVQKARMPLQPAMQWKTHIVHLKEVPAGTGISYGHTFVATRTTRVATLPVGYADGYPRALSNAGHVIVRGQFAPILGRVCMDQFMVDATEIPGVALEEEVTLVGTQGACTVTLEEIGAASASFNYETACRVGQRVPRIYTLGGAAVDFHSALLTQAQYESEYE
ncbi:MAG: alanine racemase [Oscillospiraceae bacterium]|jgi:alanine racemase|nr:alanine racemase [Oscillospiraceae bacterium]